MAEKSKGDKVTVTACKTQTNIKIDRDRHGVTRREVKSEIKR